MIRAITGHNFLGQHQNRINPEISKVCRFCEQDEESFYHLLTSCDSLSQLQNDIFMDKPHPDDNSWSIFKLKNFILEPTIFRTLSSKAGLSAIDSNPHEIPLPSDSDSSL